MTDKEHAVGEQAALETCCAKLRQVNANQLVIENFKRLHHLVASGVTGIIPDDSLQSLDQVADYSDLSQSPASRNPDLLSELIVCKLNGGLGTSMGLKKAKSLLHVRHDPQTGQRQTFNQINARQVQLLSGQKIPFLNMVSFSTDADVRADLQNLEVEMHFLMQNMHPKIYTDNFHAASHEDESLCWNPPGHGDFYLAFYSSGLLENFIGQGKKYLFVSNADNLCASPDPIILNYLAENSIPFLMEVTSRTEADKKGGHLAKRKSDGRIILRESAQAQIDASGQMTGDFQDISRHSYFNLNSIWINLENLLQVMQDNAGLIPLPLIRNQKNLDPRDVYSPQVYQLETAMGAAIEFFEGAQLLKVDRRRFAPVKTCTDLLLVLSDCFELDAKSVLIPKLAKMPLVNLSSEYKLIDDFERLIQQVPSLKAAQKFSLTGHIQISHQLEIIGQVIISDLRKDQNEPCLLSDKYSQLKDVKVIITETGDRLEEI